MGRYERIENNFSASGLTSEQFYNFFAAYAEREANKILNARSLRNEKILKIMDRIIPATAGLCGIMALVIPFI